MYSDHDCKKVFKVCRNILLLLSRKSPVHDRTTCHALALSQLFISIEGPEAHKKLSPDCPLISFWACVGIICFSISTGFHDVEWPSLADMMGVIGFPYSDYAKKFYVRVQIKFLESTQWSLYFPVGESLSSESMSSSAYY